MKGPPTDTPAAALLASADALVAEARVCTNAPPDADLVLCPRYKGMSRRDAIKFRFGVPEVPPGITAVILKNALPPDGVPLDWWGMPRGSDESPEAFRACRAMVGTTGEMVL